MALIGAHKVPTRSNNLKKPSEDDLQWVKITRNNKISEEFRWLYEGQVAPGRTHGRAHGFGVLSKIHKTGEIRKIYAGSWVDGKKQGLGALWYSNGDFYEGEFCRGLRHGFGRLWMADGGFYQGNFRDELFDGPAMLIQADGNRYEGNFSRGKKNGFGKFYHLRSGQLQDGYWVMDTCKQSTLRDISRELVPEPTIYPIPELGQRIALNFSENSS